MQNKAHLQQMTFHWTRAKWQCLHLTMLGVMKGDIARTLKVHRNTVSTWTNHPVFISEFARRQNERDCCRTRRRIHHTSKIGDALEEMILHTLEKCDRLPLGRRKAAMIELSKLTRQYARIRHYERLDCAYILEGRQRGEYGATR